MPEFTVQEYKGHGTPFGSDPQMVGHEVQLEEWSGSVFVYRPAGKQPDFPTEAGATWNGTVDTSKKTAKFVFDRQNGSQRSSPGAQSEGPGEDYWEAKNRAITRQHSEHMALLFAQSCGGFSAEALTDPNKTSAALTTIRKLADWFDKDVDHVADWPKDEEGPAKTADEVPF
jgi:hypothetical protein